VTSPRIVCLYAGPAHDCPECGGYSRQGGLCSDECADTRAARLTAQEAAEAARRHEEEVFGRAVGQLLYFGFTEAEADQLLRGIT
jgi:hypothetical protein